MIFYGNRREILPVFFVHLVIINNGLTFEKQMGMGTNRAVLEYIGIRSPYSTNLICAAIMRRNGEYNESISGDIQTV